MTPIYVSLPSQSGFTFQWVAQNPNEFETFLCEISNEEQESLHLFLRHFETVSVLVSHIPTVDRLSNGLFRAFQPTTMDLAAGLALVGSIFVQRTVGEFSSRSFYGAIPAEEDDLGERTVALSRVEAWALNEAYRAFCEDLMPQLEEATQSYFLTENVESFKESLSILESFLLKYQWLQEPLDGYRRLQETALLIEQVEAVPA